MRIVLFSDLHAHPFQAEATILPNGMNSRLADAISCIDQIVEYCVHNSIDLVLFGGDLFHVRKNIAVAAFNEVFASLSQFAVNDIPLALIHGNHDQASKDGTVHSLRTLHSIAHVIEQPGWMVVRGKGGDPYSILGVPYTENIEHLKDVVNTPNPEPLAHSIMLAHLGVQGAKVGADFVYATPYDAKVEDLNCPAFDRVYLGHYHMHQQLAHNAWYIGAPLQHNWGDKHQWRGFLVYDTDTETHELVRLNAPQFVELDAAKEHHYQGGADFVRLLELPGITWSSDQLEAERLRLGARTFKVINKPDKDKANTARIEISSVTGFHEAVEKYVQSGLVPTDGLEDEYLLQLGRDILDEAGK